MVLRASHFELAQDLRTGELLGFVHLVCSLLLSAGYSLIITSPFGSRNKFIRCQPVWFNWTGLNMQRGKASDIFPRDIRSVA